MTCWVTIHGGTFTSDYSKSAINGGFPLRKPIQIGNRSVSKSPAAACLRSPQLHNSPAFPAIDLPRDNSLAQLFDADLDLAQMAATLTGQEPRPYVITAWRRGPCPIWPWRDPRSCEASPCSVVAQDAPPSLGAMP